MTMDTITPNSLDYTAVDYGSLRRRLFLLIASVFPTWTDTDVADFGNLLVESFARSAEVLVFYQNRQANESRITTALLRKSLLAFAKLVGFVARGSVASQATETFTLVNTSGTPTANGADVIVPAATVVQTLAQPTPVQFQLLLPLTIPAGQTSEQATVENSAPYTDSFVGSGLASQTWRLTQVPYLDGSVVVTAGNGSYTEVPSLLGSASTDLVFYTTVDENDSCVVTFGDGNLGAIPTGTVFLEYKTWNGLVGQVAVNTLTATPGAFVDVHGGPVRIVVTNAAASTPGVDRQSVGELRELIPQQTQVPRAAVCRADFEVGARGVLGVARALCLTSNEDTSVGENAGFLFIVPIGGGAPSDILLEEVQGRFLQVAGQPAPDLPCLSTFQLTTVGDPYLTVNVYCKINKRKGYTGAAVKANILAALAAWFAPQNPDGSSNTLVDFGYYLQSVDGTPTQSLAYSDLFTLVDKTAGVLKIGAGLLDFTLNGVRGDVPLTPRQFPMLGSVEIYDGDASVVL
jgi:Baseplate J-like protein